MKVIHSLKDLVGVVGSTPSSPMRKRLAFSDFHSSAHFLFQLTLLAVKLFKLILATLCSPER